VIAGAFVLFDSPYGVIDLRPRIPEITGLAVRVPHGYAKTNFHDIVFAYVFRPAFWAAEAWCHSFGKRVRADLAILDMFLDALGTIRSARSLVVAGIDLHTRSALNTQPRW
jgi:hypothetical protein